MTMEKNNLAHAVEPLLNLIMEDRLDSILEQWLGRKILLRGMDYARKKRGRDLAIAENGWIVATVTGSEEYLTGIFMDENGELDGACSCPCLTPCKHMAALALTARETLRREKALPVCDKLDIRGAMLAALDVDLWPAQESLAKNLAAFSKKDLLALLLAACGLDDNVRLFCAASAHLGKIDRKPAALALQDIFTDAVYEAQYEEDYPQTPNYAEIARRLRHMAGKAAADDWPDNDADYAEDWEDE